MKFLVHPSTFGNQHRVHLNSGICCSNNRDHFFASLTAATIFIVASLSVSFYRVVSVVERSSHEYSSVLDAVSHDVFLESKEIRIASTPTIISPSDAKWLYRDFGLIGMNVAIYGLIKAAADDINRNLDGYTVVTDVLGPRYNANIYDGITFNRDGEPRFIKSFSGISGRESWGRWTDGDEASITFTQPLPQKFTLKIVAGTSAAQVGKPVQIIVGTTQLDAIFSKNEAT